MIRDHLKTIFLLSFTSAFLVACSGSMPVKAPAQPRAHYSVFTDSTWVPEDHIRAPYGATEIALPIDKALEEGVHAFVETNESLFTLKKIDGKNFEVTETLTTNNEKALSWGEGASILYRNSRPVIDWGKTKAQKLADGRLLLSVRGNVDVNFAARMLAFNISGKPIRQIIRDANNQPDTLAWYMKGTEVFPTGSVAYIFTYWLGDDEVIWPAKGTFTGAATLEKLMQNFSEAQPFCLAYIDHTHANPYGAYFDKKSLPKSGITSFLRKLTKTGRIEGDYYSTNASHEAFFCQKAPTTKPVAGRWVIRYIQGTRVLELKRPEGVSSSDLGIQPVNKDSIGVGFAEIESKTASGRIQKKVVPVRILHNNKPITDFRVKFNGIAAKALRKAAKEAAKAKAALESSSATEN